MKRCVQVLNEALHEVFAARDDVYLLGEDILDPVRRRLQGEPGPERRVSRTGC